MGPTVWEPIASLILLSRFWGVLYCFLLPRNDNLRRCLYFGIGGKWFITLFYKNYNNWEQRVAVSIRNMPDDMVKWVNGQEFPLRNRSMAWRFHVTTCFRQPARRGKWERGGLRHAHIICMKHVNLPLGLRPVTGQSSLCQLPPTPVLHRTITCGTKSRVDNWKGSRPTYLN